MATTKPGKVRKKLRRAMVDHTLVRIERSIARADVLDGYVVGVGDQWFLLHWLDQRIHLDGFVALRIEDVRRIDPARAGAFKREALELHGDWPPTMPIDRAALDDTRALVLALGASFPLLSLFPEIDDPNRCFIGTALHMKKRSVWMRCLSPEAEWIDEPWRWKLDDITRIEAGDGYSQALHDVAGPAPTSND